MGLKRFLQIAFCAGFYSLKNIENHLPTSQERKNIVVYILSRLDIDSLKIQDNTEEALTLLSGSENSSITYIKLTIPKKLS
jgi:hypothetical protein